MFRAAVLSIALSLAVGPQASLLCKAWCNPVAAAASGCHAHGSSADSAGVVGDGTCDGVAAGVALLEKDARRSVSDPNADHAVSVPPYLFAPATIGGRLDYQLGHLLSLDKRPLETALRI